MNIFNYKECLLSFYAEYIDFLLGILGKFIHNLVFITFSSKLLGQGEVRSYTSTCFQSNLKEIKVSGY